MIIKVVGGPRDGAVVDIPCERDDLSPYYDVLEDDTTWHRYIPMMGPPDKTPVYQYFGVREEQTNPWWHRKF